MIIFYAHLFVILALLSLLWGMYRLYKFDQVTFWFISFLLAISIGIPALARAISILVKYYGG